VTVVADASTVAAGLIGSGAAGRWAETLLRSEELAEPHFMPAEVAGVFRRAVLAGRLSAEIATLAYADLTALRTELHPYAPYAARVWELRASVTPYDAWYIALAEALGVPLATADARLARVSGPRCAFLTPPL
jgi:predicted nucleic acid-binding protein